MIRHAATSAILIGSLCGAFFLTAALRGQQPPAAAPAEEPNDLFIVAGKSLVVDSTLPIDRVSVGLGDIAEATAVGPREILVNGKTPGETSLIIWQQGGGKLFFDVKVQPSGYASNSRADALKKEISAELPGQKVEASVENDLIFLRGTVKDLNSAERAMAIASSLGKPVNLLYVDVPPPDQQILLHVKFASVDRSRLTQAGLNIFSTGATNTLGTISTQQFSPPTVSNSGNGGSGGGVAGNNGVTATISNFLNLFFFRPDLNLGVTIQALEQKNIVEILAEPNVIAENGKPASFLAGGEFPYPVVQGGTVGGTTAVTIQFRQYGVRLNFIPTITPRGTIRLQVAPEVSTLDYVNSLNVSGFTVPGLSVRNVNTEVELGEGQSFAIGGLLDNRETETFSKIPFIGDIPILGKFFQSKNKSKTNTELMVIVSPEIVRPMPADKQIATPNYPVPFLPANSPTPMSQPGQAITGPASVTPPTPTVPLETLQKSLQEIPLTVSTTNGNFGQAQSGAAGAAPASPAPAAAAPR